jgi:hypothetical protein
VRSLNLNLNVFCGVSHSLMPNAEVELLLAHGPFFLTYFPVMWNKPNCADPNGRAVLGDGMGPIACWGCGFDPAGGHGCLCCVCCTLMAKGTGQGNQDQETSTDKV